MIHNIPQPDFEAFVADMLEDDPLVEMKKNVAFITCEQVGDLVLLYTHTHAADQRAS